MLNVAKNWNKDNVGKGKTWNSFGEREHDVGLSGQNTEIVREARIRNVSKNRNAEIVAKDKTRKLLRKIEHEMWD